MQTSKEEYKEKNLKIMVLKLRHKIRILVIFKIFKISKISPCKNYSFLYKVVPAISYTVFHHKAFFIKNRIFVLPLVVIEINKNKWLLYQLFLRFCKTAFTAPKMKTSIKDFFSKYDQIRWIHI